MPAARSGSAAVLEPRPPRVSILMPTYNRERFLPKAFASIFDQTMRDWELIVVDDGSTDETADYVARQRERTHQSVRYVRQENAGAYAARNTALSLASGEYVAFFDTDDVWLPHHLSACVGALDETPDVDWVYGACRIVEDGTGRLIAPSTFRVDGAVRPFLRLHTRQAGSLRVFDDGRIVETAFTHGLYCGLQNSVVRRSVFPQQGFQTIDRNEAEDQLFLIRMLKQGRRLGYLDAVHVEYRVHDGNSSGSATGRTLERDLAVYQPVARGFERLLAEFEWTPKERRALSRRLAREHFWHLGYSILWSRGRRREAIRAFEAGLQFWPWSLRCWKTYLLARLRQRTERP